VANFIITEATSVARFGLIEHAFSGDSALADKLVVNAGAFLVAQGQGAAGAYLAPTRAWTATINGSVFSLQYAGVYLDWGNTAVSTITLGEEGAIGGVYGIYALSSATIKNAGAIAGRDHGIRIFDPGTRTITNSGSISGGLYSILDETGTSTDKVTNTGTLVGQVDLGGGNNVFSSSGHVEGDFFALGGNDSFKNTGVIGSVYLGDGANRFENRGGMANIEVGAGNDVLVNSGGLRVVTLGGGADTLTNSGIVAGTVSGSGGNKKIVNSGTMRDIDLAVGNHTIVNTGTITLNIELMGGIDVVSNSGSVQEVHLGGGFDTLTNTGAIARVYGGPGRTTITNRGTIDAVFVEGGNTIVNSGVIHNIVFSGDGNDTVTNSGTINSLVALGGGDDVFVGSARRDSVIDGAGADTYRLGAGDDLFFATSSGPLDGADFVDGGAGIDSYESSGGAVFVVNIDTVSHTLLDILPFATFFVSYAANSAGASILPGAIKDTIVGFENVVANGTIFGSKVANVLAGLGGDDGVLGFGGNDVLYGGAGADKLHGGAGRDILTGGAGADGFFYSAASESGPKLSQRDTITDFENGLDYISLVRIDANTKNGSADDAFNFIGFNVTFSGVPGELRAIYAADGVLIEGDVNGDRKADLSIFLQDPAHTLNASTLTAADFWL
jgi:hypothetical protein